MRGVWKSEVRGASPGDVIGRYLATLVWARVQYVDTLYSLATGTAAMPDTATHYRYETTRQYISLSNVLTLTILNRIQK